MTDENKKLNVSENKERLFSDMSELAMDESMDSENFLKSLTELIDSEEYSELTDKLTGESLKPSPSETKSEDTYMTDSDDGYLNNWDIDEADSSDNWGKDNYQDYSDDDFYDYEDDDDEVAEVEWAELFPAVNSGKRVNSETTMAEDEAVKSESVESYYAEADVAKFKTEEVDSVESESKNDDTFESKSDSDESAYNQQQAENLESKNSDFTKSEMLEDSAVVLKEAMSEEFPLELGEIENDSSEDIGNTSLEKTGSNSDNIKSSSTEESESVTENCDIGTDSSNVTEKGPEESEAADSDSVTEESEEEPAEGEKELTPEEIKARKRQKLMWNLVSAACMLVFLYCAWEIANYFITGSKYKSEMKEVQDLVGNIAVEPVIIEPKTTEIFFPDEVIYVEDKGSVVLNNEISDEWAETYKTLVELNPDCMGWIQIPDTNIDYPVMYTPNDYDKYLYLNFEEDYQFRGLPFLAEGTVLNKSQNYIMYGHYMKDGTAFQHLNKYLDRNWVKEHPYAYFYTAYDQGVYQVMDVVITKVFKEEDECFKYYNYSGELSEEDFNTYVYYMDRMSSVDTGVEAVYGDKLISLSTCFRHYDEDGRLVVVFKRIQ